LDSDPLGMRTDNLALQFSEDDIGNVMPNRVAITVRNRSVDYCLYPLKGTEPKILHIVDDIGREKLAEPSEITCIHKVPMQADQFMDREPVFGGYRHLNPSGTCV